MWTGRGNAQARNGKRDGEPPLLTRVDPVTRSPTS